MYEIICQRFWLADWDTMHADAKALVLRAYHFAHAEGRQAERVERWEKARYLLPFAEQLLTWVRIQPPSDVQLRAVAQATILVADLKEPLP